MDAITFLQLFYRYANEGFVGITYLAPDGVQVPYGGAITHFAPMPLKADIDLSNIHAMNALGYSVYFRVMVQSQRHDPIKKDNGYLTYPRGVAAESVYTRVLWGEIDFEHADEQKALTAVKAMEHQPSLVVRSGGGFHLYWLLNEVVATNGAQYTGDRGRWLYVEPDELKRTLKGIAKAIGCADTKVSELARIMRLPDTVNTKPSRNGARCEVVSNVVAATYDYRTLEMAYAPLIKSELRVERKVVNLPTDDLPRSVQDYMNSPAPTGERNDRLNKAAYALHSRGRSESEIYNLLEPRASGDGLPDHEIRNTIRSACSAVAAPVMTTRNRRVAARDRRLGSTR